MFGTRTTLGAIGILIPAVLAFFPKTHNNEIKPAAIAPRVVSTGPMLVKEVKGPIPGEKQPNEEQAVNAPAPQKENGPPEKAQIVKDKPKESLPSDNDSLALALIDVLHINFEDRYYTRYVWVTDDELEAMQASSLVLNYGSRSALIMRPFPIRREEKRLLLLRVDLRHLARTDQDIKDMIVLWEKLRFEPKFNLLLTEDTLKFTTGIDLPKVKKEVTKKKWEKKTVAPFVHTDGQTYNYYWVEKEYTEIVESSEISGGVLRVIAPHIDQSLLIPLIEATGSQIPVVTHSYFISRVLRQIQGKVPLYTTLYGGLYYEFAGIKKGFKKGTDEDNLLEKFGIGNVEAGVSAEKYFDGGGSDARIAKYFSEVTGRPRRVDMLRSNQGHITENMSLLSITQDPDRDTIDIADHPMLNLVKVRVKGKELIAEKRNGLHLFAAFNGDGVLQDQVPDTIASDHTVPAPHQTVLEPAISCIRCHLKEGGWRILVSDVNKRSKPGLDVFDDISDLKKSTFEVLQRLAEQYHGDPELVLMPTSRNTYARSIMRATGPWGKPEDKKDQTEIVRYSGEKISAIYSRYVYDRVDAKRALLELGMEWDPKEKATDVLTRLLPPVGAEIPHLNFVREDSRISDLKDGIAITRVDWDLIYAFVAVRVQNTLRKGVKR